jgi:hypothetical protein
MFLFLLDWQFQRLVCNEEFTFILADGSYLLEEWVCILEESFYVRGDCTYMGLYVRGVHFYARRVQFYGEGAQLYSGEVGYWQFNLESVDASWSGRVLHIIDNSKR